MVNHALRLLFAWLLASLVAALIGCISLSTLNLRMLTQLGAPLDGVQIAKVVLADLTGLGGVYFALVAAALLIALPVASWLTRRLPRIRWLLYLLAGASAIACMLWLMRTLLGVTVFYGARFTGGFALLVMGGALGAWLFAAMRKPGRQDS
jgi:hypothetical protein